MKRETWLVMALFPATTGTWMSLPGQAAEEPPSAADLVRRVYAAEAWVREVETCLLRTRGVQRKPGGRAASHSPSAEELEELHRGSADWEEVQRWRQEIAWDRTRVRATQDHVDLRRHVVSAWDGKTMIRHEKAPRADGESYGIYDDSRKDLLLSFRVNLWDNPGCATRDLHAWWPGRDAEKSQATWFKRPEDFRLAGKSLVDGRACHVVESRAGLMRLYIDASDGRLRRFTQLGVPNDLDDGVMLSAMRKAGKADLASPGEWRSWIGTLDPARRLEAERGLLEELVQSMRIHSETYPADHVRVGRAGWMPRRITVISSYPDWDVVEKTGRYTYEVDRVDIELTELKVDEPLSGELLTIGIPEGGRVFDWRFDPPVEYAFRKDRTEEEVRALAEEARRKHQERTAPHREMAAEIDKRLGRMAPELPRKRWFNGDPLKIGELRGKVIVLHFWATWCGPCHDDLRTLVALGSSATSRPLVIGIHDGKADVAAVEKAIAERGMKYPILIDAESEGEEGASQRSWYGIRGIPYTIVIDREGRVAAHGALRDMLERAGRME